MRFGRLDRSKFRVAIWRGGFRCFKSAFERLWDAARSVVIFQTAQPVAEFRGLAHLDHLGVCSLWGYKTERAHVTQ